MPLTQFDKSDYALVRISNYDYDLAIQKMPDGTYETLVMKCTHAGHPLTKQEILTIAHFTVASSATMEK